MGTTFLAKSPTLDDFGVPGASLGEALGRILGDKFRGEKNDEKKVWKLIASAGHADPGQDPPAGFLKHGPARLRSSSGWAGGSLGHPRDILGVFIGQLVALGWLP